MKEIKLTKKLLSFSIGCLFILGGCDNSVVTANQKETHRGHFVNVFNNKINYHCADEVIALSDDGEFECQSFPISFYMDNVKLGEISSIHSDGYVFPQDIIVLEERSAVYSSDDNMKLASLQE